MFMEKKGVEQAQLDIFRSLYSEFPDGNVVPYESPDFLVVEGGCTIGIELTDLFWDSSGGAQPRQAQEQLTWKICQRARTMWGASPPVHVSVHFNDGYSLSKKDIDRLASAIVDVAKRLLPPQAGHVSEDYDYVNRHDFPVEVLSISVYRIDELTETFFSDPSAAYIPKLRKSDMIRPLEAKESKYEKYREKCDEVWLIVNVNHGRLSTRYDLKQDTLNARYTSSFDKVFLVDQGRSKLWELSTVKA